MGQHSGVIAALKCVASAYERGDVTADVIDSLQQLLPFSRYVSIAICGPGVWLASSGNLMDAGPISLSLLPKDESIAGVAASLSRQLRSFKATADQRFYDVENFHAKYGAGALVATPLLSSSSRRVKGLKGLHEHKSFGALLVDLDLQPGTPIDLRMRALIKDFADDLAGLIEQTGRKIADQVDSFCFDDACEGNTAPCCTYEGCTMPDREDDEGGHLSADGIPRKPRTVQWQPQLQRLEADAGAEVIAAAARRESALDDAPVINRPAEPCQQQQSCCSGSALQTAGLGSLPNGCKASSCKPRCKDAGEAGVSQADAGTSSALPSEAEHMHRVASDDIDVTAQKKASPRAAQREALSTKLRQHPLWLSFFNRALEKEFATWHSMQLQKLDRGAVAIATIIFAMLGFMEPHSFAKHAPVFYGVTMTVLLALLYVAWTANPWYLARRTLILKLFVLLYTAFNSQIGFPRVLDAMPPGDRGCSVPFMLRYINAQPLLTSCVVTMSRFKIQAPLQLLQLGMSLALPAKLCRACHNSQPLLNCLSKQHALQFLVGFLVPCAFVYLVEMRFRRQFLTRKAC